MTTRLSLATLDRLPSAVSRPSYRREQLSPGIVHFGVGNFHRAHQALYLDDLFNTGRDRDWAIVGAGVMPGDARARDILAAQDWLTTLVEQDANGARAKVTGSMVDYIAPGDVAGVIGRLCDPAIRIVSLTITEGGYFIDPATGIFDAAHPAIRADATEPSNPSTVFGLIVAGLKARRAAGLAPFTVMSCDNIPHNGVVARNAITGLARLVDPGLADWIEAEVAFPNGMVDRITPATGERERRLVVEDHGVADAWPVFCETFRQWVLEDRFTAGRPELERVGVEFVDDVSPYELMKIRILNGGHAVIAYPSGLLGIEFAHEAMADPLVSGFLAKIEREEIVPAVPPVPGVDLPSYAAKVAERFANPRIGDTIRRLCLDGSNRQPKFIVPTVAARLAANLPVGGLALESALWCRYCFGTDERGNAIEPNDPNWDRLTAVAREARARPQAWLAMDDIYGDVGKAEPFSRAFAQALTALWAEGTEAVLRRYVEG